MTGFIKAHRKMTEWEWYTDANVFRVFMHLLFTASYRRRSWRGIEINRGQCLTSSNKLAGDLNLSRQEVRTVLQKLQSTNEIKVRPTKQGTVITLCNYSRYNDSEQTINQPELFDINQPTSKPTNPKPQKPTNLEHAQTLTVSGIEADEDGLATNPQPARATTESAPIPTTSTRSTRREEKEVVVVNGTELLRDEEEANAEIIVEQQQRQQHHNLPSACYGVPVQTENRYRDAKPIYVSPTSDRPNGQTSWEKKAGEGDAIGALCAILSMSEDQIESVTVELGGSREIMEAYAKSRATNNFQNRQNKTISPLNFRFDLGGFISAWRNREKENPKPKKKGPRVPKDWRDRALALGVEEAKNERFYPLYELLERDVRMSIEADWKAEQEAKGITA